MPHDRQEVGKFVESAWELICYVRTLLFLVAAVVAIVVVVLWQVDGKSLGDAVYLAFISFLTIGYGDLAPSCGIAKAACVLVGFTGIIFMGIIVAITTLSIGNEGKD